MFFLSIFFLLAVSEEEKCLETMNRRELRDFVREQESIASITVGRIILQLMEKVKEEKKIEMKEKLRTRLEREILTYKQLMRRSQSHFLTGEGVGITADTLVRFGFFLIQRDCRIPKDFRQNLEKDFSLYWNERNLTERISLLDEIKQKVITCPVNI